MRRFVETLRNLLAPRRVHRFVPRPRRLTVEVLEGRTLLSVTSATVTGTAFIDPTGTGALQGGDVLLTGANVTLTGSTVTGAPVNVTTQTNSSGVFTFNNVQLGTYTLTGDTVPGLPSGTLNTPAPITITQTAQDASTVTENLAYAPLQADSLSLKFYLASATGSTLPFQQTAGTTPGAVSFRSNSAPTVKNPLPNITGHAGGDTLSLGGFFSDSDLSTGTMVRFDTSAGPINVQLFDQQAPQTVANFLNYVGNKAYDNMIFSRLVNGFVLQGGQFTYQSNPVGLAPVPVLGIQTPNVIGPNGVVGTGVPSEFTTPGLETAGSLAMALSGANTATNEFFFNLADNSSNLDTQAGGFTVFGKVASSTDLLVLNSLVAQGTPSTETFTDTTGVTHTASSSATLDTRIPLTGISNNDSKFPGDTTPSNYEFVNDVVVTSRNEQLTYSVVNNTNPGLVTPSVSSSFLNLNYAAGQTGSSTITVRATDEFGASVDSTFTVTVGQPSVTVKLDNSAPTVSTGSLTATAVPTAATGDTVSLNYLWQLNGTNVQSDTKTGASGSSVTDTLDLTKLTLHKGDKLSVIVTPSAGSLTGTAVTTTATVADAPPVIVPGSVNITPSSPGVGDTLTAAAQSTDADGDPVTLKFQWQRNGSNISNPNPDPSMLKLTDVSGITSGDTITVIVTPNDGTLDGQPGTASVKVS
jgi:cyclophilin family peptidyl-prolyl cis-trans isomerase